MYTSYLEDKIRIGINLSFVYGTSMAYKNLLRTFGYFYLRVLLKIAKICDIYISFTAVLWFLWEKQRFRHSSSSFYFKIIKKERTIELKLNPLFLQ